MAALAVPRSTCVQLMSRACVRGIKPVSPLAFNGNGRIPQFLGRRAKSAAVVPTAQALQKGNPSHAGSRDSERAFGFVAARSELKAESKPFATTAQRRSYLAAHEQDLRQAFHAFDLDNSGALDLDELRAIFAEHGGGKYTAEAKRIDSLLAAFDSNGDGVLQFEEFQNLWTGTMGSSLGEPLLFEARASLLEKEWQPKHVAVIGAGMVGSNTAFCVMSSDLGQGKVTLTDVAEELVKGQVMDLEDLGGPFGAVSAANLKEAGQADVIIVTAGRGVREGETRLDCLKANHGIMKSIIDGMQPIKKSAILLVVSNPCDVLAYYAWQFSGLPSNQVIGSGTLLDTTRFRTLLSEKIGCHVDSIHCDVLGEHGDSQFAAASVATVGGIPLDKCAEMASVDVNALLEESAKKGREIRVRKGATAFGVASSTKTIVESILKDQRKVLPVSVKVPDSDCFLSLPCVVGFQGIENILDVRSHLSAEEKAKWQICEDTMKKMMI